MSENSWIFKKQNYFLLIVSDESHNQAFSSEQTQNKTENANLTCGEPKTPTALKLNVEVFGPLINPYWLKEATTAIKVLQSSRNI